MIIQNAINLEQVEDLRSKMKLLLHKNVEVAVNESATKGNPKILHYSGELISISKNILSVEMKLGKTNKMVKSFLLNDLLINKVAITQSI